MRSCSVFIIYLFLFHSPPQTAAPGVWVPVAGGIAGAQRAAWLLVGDEPQGTRRFPGGAALLSGPLRCPLFAGAEEDANANGIFTPKR